MRKPILQYIVNIECRPIYLRFRPTVVLVEEYAESGEYVGVGFKTVKIVNNLSTVADR